MKLRNMYSPEEMRRILRIQRWRSLLRSGKMSFRKYEAMMWRTERDMRRFREEEMPALLRRQV